MIARGNAADSFESGNASISIFSGSFFSFFFTEDVKLWLMKFALFNIDCDPIYL